LNVRELAGSRLRRLVGVVRGVRSASRLQKEGRRLYLAGHFAEAIAPLQEALALIGFPRIDEPALLGVRFSMRMSALMLLSYSFAKLDDRQQALAAIHTGMALLAAFKMAESSQWKSCNRARQPIREWQQWARAYLAFCNRSTGTDSAH
jgi:hypothetical protein